jgi:hypothetical protein
VKKWRVGEKRKELHEEARIRTTLEVSLVELPLIPESLPARIDYSNRHSISASKLLIN